MPLDFPSAPSIEGLTYLAVRPVFFTDLRAGRREIFPVFSYREDATGELILVAEPRYDEILDRLIAMGAFGSNEGPR